MKLISELQQSAELLHCVSRPDDLHYVDDTMPGIERQRDGEKFVYLDIDRRLIDCDREIARIEALGIPPAWANVWICASAQGHLQATGFDEAGRKQYRYHEAWRVYREQTKFRSLIHFGAYLPRLRRRIRTTFRTEHKPNRELVIAALVRLLDDAPLRIGNANTDSDAIGASTLRRRNITVSKTTLRLDYTAKGGKRVRRQIKDARLLKVLDRIDDLPGRTVFRYVGDDGEVYPLRSEQVNDWLKDVTGDSDVSAKMFRTWSGSLAAFTLAVTYENITIKAMSEVASEKLRNTPAIARSSYIHPAIVALNEDTWETRKCLLDRVGKSAADLTRNETAMLHFLARTETSQRS